MHKKFTTQRHGTNIDDYDDITLIWLLCIIRGIELAKDSPWDTDREGGRAGAGEKRRGTSSRVCETEEARER